MTRAETEYANFIDGLELRHFSGHEFVSYSRRRNRGGTAGVPPKKLWGNIVPTIQILDFLRAELDAPISLTSIYRSAGYNKACGGASRSQHRQFTACDIQTKGVAPSEVFGVLKNWREERAFVGGLGLYKTFVHIDTRNYNATWGV